ncbi:MAG: LamG domain-containing protein [Syntrophomonas sp.]
MPAALDILKKSGFKPEDILLDPQQYQTPSPSRYKAAVFDTAYDNPIHMETPVDKDVALKLKQMGYYVDLYTSWADLYFASKLDAQAYGLIYFCGHGAMVGGDWYFTVRPYYNSPPPDDSGYTGTKVFSVYTGNGYDIAYVYGFGKEFAQTYWTNAFRGTIFAVESCNSANSSIVPSLPRWAVDHGASAWLGWNGSVKIKVGDQMTTEFFNQLSQWKSVEEARVKINSINASKPPEMIRVASTEPTFKANADVSLPHWAWETNEQQYPAGKNFYMFTAEKYGEDAYLYIFSVLNMPLFHLYLDNNADGKADVDVKFNPDSYEVYSVASDGKTNLEQFGKVSNLPGGYRAVIPWSTLFGTGVMNRYRLADGSNGDVMPDTGWLSAVDGTVITTPDASTGGGTGGTGNGSFGTPASTDSSLIAEYKFNGDFKDATGRGNDGIKAGDVSFAEDSVMGKCVVFNGGFINVKSIPELNLGDNFTISLWVKVDTANKVNPMISKTTDNGSYNIYSFLTRSTYGIEADLPTSSGPGMVVKDGPFTDLHLDEGWSHLVFTRNGATVYAYHNGVQIAKRDFYTGDGKMQSSIGNMRIGNGSDINHKDVLFKGNMDDLRIYNRTLSVAEILALYNGGTPTGN